jgi:hypothetical protein
VTQDQIATYRAALTEARTSYNQATKRLAEIKSESFHLTKDVSRLRRTITALAAMCSEDPLLDNLGITESCLEVMQSETGTVTTAEVVKGLERIGFDLESQKNAAASVHAVLTRLAAKKKITKVTEDGGDTVAWRGPNYDEKWDKITEEDIPF